MGQTIAERIRIIRVSRRLTQENVADEIGITHGAYAKIERGETDPNTSRLMDIARALKVDITDFFESYPVSSVKEPRISYGHVTREEVELLRYKVDNLTTMIQSQMQEMEKLRLELSKIVHRKKK